MPWAAAGRLRVACFLSAFFDTMTTRMQSDKFDKLEYWRINFLHSENEVSANQIRDQFWYEVVKNALVKLRENDCEQLKQWVLYQQNQKIPILTNAKINTALKKILRPSMTKFFNSPIVIESLRQCTMRFNNREWDLPFLFIVDEAAYLFKRIICTVLCGSWINRSFNFCRRSAVPLRNDFFSSCSEHILRSRILRLIIIPRLSDISLEDNIFQLCSPHWIGIVACELHLRMLHSNRVRKLGV